MDSRTTCTSVEDVNYHSCQPADYTLVSAAQCAPQQGHPAGSTHLLSTRISTSFCAKMPAGQSVPAHHSQVQDFAVLLLNCFRLLSAHFFSLSEVLWIAAHDFILKLAEGIFCAIVQVIKVLLVMSSELHMSPVQAILMTQERLHIPLLPFISFFCLVAWPINHSVIYQ